MKKQDSENKMVKQMQAQKSEPICLYSSNQQMQLGSGTLHFAVVLCIAVLAF